LTKLKTDKKKFEKFLSLIQGKAKGNDAALGSSSLVNKIVLDAHENEITCLTASTHGNVMEFVRLSGVEVMEEGKISLPIKETMECLKTLKGGEIEIEFDRSLKMTDGKSGWEFTTDLIENIPDFDSRNPWDFLSSPLGTKEEIPKHLQRKTRVQVTVNSGDVLNAINAGTIAGKRNKTLLVEIEADFEKSQLKMTSGLVGEKINYTIIDASDVNVIGDGKNAKSKFSYGIGNVFNNVSGDVEISFISVRDNFGKFGDNIFVKHDDGTITAIYYISRVAEEAIQVEKA